MVDITKQKYAFQQKSNKKGSKNVVINVQRSAISPSSAFESSYQETSVASLEAPLPIAGEHQHQVYHIAGAKNLPSAVDNIQN
jgi:hypothetical protein